MSPLLGSGVGVCHQVVSEIFTLKTTLGILVCVYLWLMEDDEDARLTQQLV